MQPVLYLSYHGESDIPGRNGVGTGEILCDPFQSSAKHEGEPEGDGSGLLLGIDALSFCAAEAVLFSCFCNQATAMIISVTVVKIVVVIAVLVVWWR